MTRKRKAGSVCLRIVGVGRQLVIVDEAESRRDVEVASPGAERLRRGDDVAIGVGDDERGGTCRVTWQRRVGAVAVRVAVRRTRELDAGGLLPGGARQV